MKDELTLKTWGQLTYKEVHSKESFGKENYGIKIFFTVDRELSSEERVALYKAAELVEEAVLRENLRLDPKEQKDKEEEKASLLSCFGEAFQVEELPSEYCSHYCCSQKPWYRVLTRAGWIKIGWRKSVINIDWTETVNKLSGKGLFPNYSPTKSGTWDKERYLHAYGVERAKVLLPRIINPSLMSEDEALQSIARMDEEQKEKYLVEQQAYKEAYKEATL